MANSGRSLRADPFIPQDPNVPRYSQRLSGEQWKDLKPRVSMLFSQGVTIVDILSEFHSRDIPITRNQLDRQMKKWGLQRRPQESSSLGEHVSQDTAISQQATSHESPLDNKFAKLLLNDGGPAAYMTARAIPNTGPTLESRTSDAEPDAHLEFTASSSLISPQIPRCVPPALPDKDHPRLTFIGYRHASDPSAIRQILAYSTTKYGASIKVLNRLGYMAMLLVTFGYPSDAFQISFHIIDQINRQPSVQGLSRRLLLFFVIACAHLACEWTEKLDAFHLVKQTYVWLSRCYPSAQERDQQTVSYMQVLYCLERDGCDERKMTAYWILNAVHSSLQEEGGHSIRPDMSSFDSLDSAFRFLHEDEDIRVVMDEAIGEIKECLYVNREEIDGVWSNYWHDPADGAFMGQMVACLLLRRRLGHDPKNAHVRAPPEKAGDSQKSQFFSRLQEQVLVAMCGLMSRLYRRLSISGNSHLKLSEKLTIAALSIERAIKNSPEVDSFEHFISRVADDYEEFIDVYLHKLGLRTTGRPTAEHLIGVSALKARVSTIPELESLHIPFMPCPILKHQGGLPFAVVPRRNHPTTKSSRRSDQEIKLSATESWLGPSLARSYTSSMSSGYRSFKAAAKERETVSSGHRTPVPPVPSVNWSDFMSLPSMLTAMHDFEPHAEDEDMTS